MTLPLRYGMPEGREDNRVSGEGGPSPTRRDASPADWPVVLLSPSMGQLGAVRRGRGQKVDHIPGEHVTPGEIHAAPV